MTHKIGLYNTNFQMASQEMLEERIENVRNRDSKFKIISGPLVWDGKPLKDTYVLEIHYEDSERAHAQTLPLSGGGSQLFSDYMDIAKKVAEQFCKEKGLIINNHLNSWPQYQVIVSRQPQPNNF